MSKFIFGIVVLGALVVAGQAQVPTASHVFIVMEENTDYSRVVGNSSMPYLNGLINQYGLATQYYANIHPSIGNYFMLTTGQILTNDDSQTPSSFPVSANNVVRELLLAGKTWKAYAEDLPSVGYTGGDTGNYAVRHNPLVYMTDVQHSSTQRLNLVPFTQFATDLANNQLPNYSFITPNLQDDLHDGTAAQADSWLQTNIAPLMASATFQQDGILIIVFDESGGDNTHGGGRVVWTVIGSKVKLGYRSTTLYQHESTLRMMLETMGITSGFPGAATSAPDMGEFFGASTLPVSVSISPTSASVQSGGTRLFAATVSNTINRAVTWSATAGSISPSGLYTAPAVTANSTATVTATSVADSTKSASATVSITATGNAFFSVSPSELTVQAGQSASYSVSVKPNSVDGPVSLSCFGLPLGAKCTFSPNPIAPSGTSTLAISTTGTTAMFRSVNPRNQQLPLYGFWFPLGVVLAGGLGEAVRKGSGKRALLVVLVMMLLVFVVFQAGCGAGLGQTTVPAAATPPGSYNITVIGTSGSVQNSIKITLLVQ